jgi:hypothetical protein
MMNSFQITSLTPAEFTMLFQFNNDELARIGALRMTANKAGKFPCRISLEDAQPGEEVILLNYQHHQTDSPYRASGPIFIKPDGKKAELDVNEIPKFLEHRYLSLRSYTKNGMMNEAFTSEGKDLALVLQKAFNNADTAYIHIHNARHGCYLCAALRLES